MKIKFKADYRDYGETAFLIWKKNNQSRHYSSFIMLFATIALISSVPILMFAPHFVYAVFNFVVILLFGIYLYRPTNLAFFRNFYRSIYKDEVYEIEVELLEEGIKIFQNGTTALFEWRNVIELFDDEEKLYLFFKFQTGISIPKHAFESPAEIGRFTAFTKAHLTNGEAIQLNG